MDKITISHLKDVSFVKPEENILYDDVLLALAEEGKLGDTFRLWESPKPFIVLGRTGKEREDLNLDAVCADKIPVLRRSSGGGTVVQGKGCLNFTFILSKEKMPALNDLRKSYRIILEGVIEILGQNNIKAAFWPISDLALVENQKKFSGNAQRRGRKFILHHGTILYDFDLSLISKYLAMPADIPEYRKARTHEQFVTNIPVTKNQLIKDFVGFYGSQSIPVSAPNAEENERISMLFQRQSPILAIKN